jgi:hypothetical protein
MRHRTAIITAVISSVFVVTVAGAATNDFPSAVLSLPKSDSAGRLESSLLPNTGSTNTSVIVTPAIVLQSTTTTNYTMRILKPNEGTNYCLQVVRPAEGTNYCLRVIRPTEGTNYGIQIFH